jgi:hypothetical protein
MVLITVSVFSAAYGQQSEEPKRQLQFETSGTIKIGEEFPEVNYVANFHVIEDRDLGPWIYAVQTTSKWKEMSEKQQQFILKLQNNYKYRSIAKKQKTGYSFSTHSVYVNTPEGTKTYRVYAVSKEDVRKMAEAVIEWHNTNARTSLDFTEKRLEKNRKVIVEAEKILSKLEPECKRLEAQAEEKIKEYAKTNHEIDRTKRKEVLEHARKNMEELARYMKLANFELIGLQARIDSIERFKASGDIIDPSTLIKLDQMLIADEIERAGIMARMKAYEGVFSQTKELYKIITSSNDAAAQKLDWEMKLTDAQKRKNETERILSKLPAQMKPVEVYENKVVIWQVKQE